MYLLKYFYKGPTRATVVVEDEEKSEAMDIYPQP
jgi:hypothetical protein